MLLSCPNLLVTLYGTFDVICLTELLKTTSHVMALIACPSTSTLKYTHSCLSELCTAPYSFEGASDLDKHNKSYACVAGRGRHH